MTTYKLNNELKGIEIYFTEKPETEILQNLKKNGFRWNGKKLCWYAKQSDKNIKIAESLSNGEKKEVSEAPEQPTKAQKNKIIPLYDRLKFTEGATDPNDFSYKSVGSNYKQGISTKETAKEIRQHLKKRFKEVKFSVTSDYNHIRVEIKESPYNYKKLEYRPELEASDYRRYETEHNKELNAILEYVKKLVKSYNYDDSDIMTDYFNVGFYSSISIDYEYKQVEASEEVKRDIKDFRNQLEADAKAEELRKKEEFKKYQEQEEKDQIEYKKRAAETEKQKEYIYKNIEIKELKNKDQYTIINSKWANLNKNNTLDEYKEEVKKGEYSTQAAKIQKEIHFKDIKALEYFSSLLLHDFDFISGTGGNYTNDKRITEIDDYYKMEREEQKTVKWNRQAVAVFYNNDIQFIIDAQGHNYSRYVGLIEQVQQEAI